VKLVYESQPSSDNRSSYKVGYSVSAVANSDIRKFGSN